MLVTGALASSSGSSAAELAHRLARLASPVRVLYVAAHPDDENTQLLTYLARGRNLRAGYLSLTRGDGGQNLIGPEQRPLLGVIRTHELLAARSLDGAEQWFTVLRDFGYSKSAEEALSVWGEARALEQVVRVFRSFRPHVVITRFPEEGSTHGHHLASARLARRAFAAAADPEQFREHIGAGLKTWKVQRLFYNFPHFWASRGKEPPPGPRFDVDVGGYDPWLGASYGEISGRSRSMHKSQGFGASARIGPWKETLVLLEGDVPAGEDPLAGLPGLADLPGAARLAEDLEAARKAFDGARSARVIPWLGRAHRAAAQVQDALTREELQREIEGLLVDAAGLFLEARSEEAEVAPGAEREVALRALVRAGATDVVLRQVRGPGFELTPRAVLETHAPWEKKVRVRAPEDAEPTRPHWLREPPKEALYATEDADEALRPVAPAPLRVTWELGVGGVGIEVEVPVERHWVDPVQGERTEPLEVAPPVSVTPEVDVLLAPKERAVELALEIAAGPEGFRGEVGFEGPAAVDPSALSLELEGGARLRRVVRLRVEGPGELRVSARPAGKEAAPAWTQRVVDHPHIPRVRVRSSARVRLSPVNLEVSEGTIGYIPGSGDRVAEILGRVGFDVETLDARTLGSGDLSKYRAILVGIRAFNVNEALVAARERLMAYVKGGGRVLVQYNTKNWSAKLDIPIGPFPITISRGRVTDETAAVKLLAPEHPALRAPHRVSSADFDGWVQERGLYFAESWDERYTPLFEMSDPGEEPLRGSTLIAPHGEGVFLFSGLSFFRQLPAGVPGALRLLVNLLVGGEA